MILWEDKENRQTFRHAHQKKKKRERERERIIKSAKLEMKKEKLQQTMQK